MGSNRNAIQMIDRILHGTLSLKVSETGFLLQVPAFFFPWPSSPALPREQLWLGLYPRPPNPRMAAGVIQFTGRKTPRPMISPAL